VKEVASVSDRSGAFSISSMRRSDSDGYQGLVNKSSNFSVQLVFKQSRLLVFAEVGWAWPPAIGHNAFEGVSQ
jgi:hypothetical protein